MRSSQILAGVLALTTFTAAWSPLDSFNDLQQFSGLDDVILRRQDDQPQDEQPAETSRPADRTTARPAATPNSSDQPEETGEPTARQSGGDRTVTDEPSRTRDGDEPPETTEFDPRLPAGGVSMVEPNPMSGAEYYKVGENITFVWNYTSLSVTPSFIDVMAYCSKNQGTYTIAVNHTAASPTVVWDTNPESQTVPFLTETYTLIIYDAQSSISAVPKAGYLASWNQFTFGMYTRQSYVPLSEFQCPTCNRNAGSILSAAEKQTLGFMFGMAAVTVISFTWFGSGFGAFAI